jgi:hypothetical protein
MCFEHFHIIASRGQPVLPHIAAMSWSLLLRISAGQNHWPLAVGVAAHLCCTSCTGGAIATQRRQTTAARTAVLEAIFSLALTNETLLLWLVVEVPCHLNTGRDESRPRRPIFRQINASSNLILI